MVENVKCLRSELQPEAVGKPEVFEQRCIQVPIPRPHEGIAAEVADTAVLLASPQGRGLTGNVLFVDAGMHIIGL